MPKFTELPGASPPGPPPGLCPGPAGGLTAPPDPQLFFWSLWPRHYQNASDGPASILHCYDDVDFKTTVVQINVLPKQ